MDISTVVGAISGAAWTTYGVAHHEVWVALPSLVGMPATAAALVIAWRRGAARTRLWLPVAWAAVLATTAVAGPWVGSTPLTVALGFSIALMIAPAAITAWRSHDVSALAANAWGLLILTRLAIPAYVHELLVPHPPVHADLPAAGDPVAVNAVLHELELEWDG